MTDTSFLPDALEINRGGRLSGAQLDDRKGMIARTHDGLAGRIGRHVDPIYPDARSTSTPRKRVWRGSSTSRAAVGS